MSKTRNILQDDILSLYEHDNIMHRPGTLQFISTDWLFIIICTGGWLAIAMFSSMIKDVVCVLWAFYTLCLFFHCQYITTMKFHIGGEQLMYQRGLFTLKRDYVEMYRIVDYEERRNFIEILLGIKTVIVYACDRTTPELKIIGVPSGLDVIGALRERVALCRKAHGVYEIANK